MRGEARAGARKGSGRGLQKVRSEAIHKALPPEGRQICRPRGVVFILITGMHLMEADCLPRSQARRSAGGRVPDEKCFP